MKKVTIVNSVNGKAYGAVLADPTAWVDECTANNTWGAPGEYEIVIEDITAEHEALEQKKLDRVSAHDRIKAKSDEEIRGMSVPQLNEMVLDMRRALGMD